MNVEFSSSHDESPRAKIFDFYKHSIGKEFGVFINRLVEVGHVKSIQNTLQKLKL